MFSGIRNYVTIGLLVACLAIVAVWRIQVAILQKSLADQKSQLVELKSEVEDQKVTLATRSSVISGLEDTLRLCKEEKAAAEDMTRDCLTAVRTTGEKLEKLRTRLSTAKVVAPEEVGHVISLQDSVGVMRDIDAR